MLLSSTDQSPPNNPSSSSNFLHLTNSSDELGQSHLSRFSIRDYAFSYRTKNINKSWPFSSKSLQLCLRHGLNDPLPPIQLLGSVISHPPQALPLKNPNITQVEEAAISYKRKSGKQGFEKNGLLATTIGSKSKIQVAIVNKNPRKKIPGGCVDSGSKEDQSCLFAASESMALRTCPICKTFSSASNTTLNAHIDQCLSVDSEQQPISKPNRPRIIKPRLKVKTMVDIYAAAKGCTLEDLDKRNGTKWAVGSSYSNRVVSDNKPQVSNKGKKRSLLRARVDEDAAGIGPVYIDAKGQKLRILSKFNEKTSDPSKEKKSSSQGKGNESFRKRLGGNKYHKHRKLIAPRGNASETLEYQSGYSEEGRGMDRSEDRGIDHRMLRKRDVSKNGNKKGTETGDEPSENGYSLSSGDALVLRDPSHVSSDLSETVSSSLNSQNSWRICEESQVSRRKSTKSASFVANPLRCLIPSKAKGFMKLKKARMDFSENEEEEDTGKWESEMTQERELTDYDDWDRNGEMNEVLLSEESDYESFEETGDNKGDDDDDMLDKTDAEFESIIYEKTSCEAAEQESSFMEVDPIPIPGPPGSFLPSPWDDAIENHGNSSVITSQIQSSQDQLDRNSSESPVSAISNFAAPESLHNIITIDKRPSRFRDNDQPCCCQRKEKASEDTTTFGQPPQMMIQQDFHLLNKSIPSYSNPVLRLMGKDLMVINQREDTSRGDSNLSKTPQLSSPLHRPFHTSTSFYNFP